MRLHAYQLPDGTMHIVAERLAAALDARSELDGHDLGVADVDLAQLSPDLVLGIGMDAWAIARGDDALLIRDALVAQAI
ncbi:MAG TPA: hypothetical protein VFE72_01645 [Lysobacter sp.]|nr:hypothetical protein [Lysobacter sp.]